MAQNIGQLVAETFERVWEETPCSMFGPQPLGALAQALGLRTYNYRERLDAIQFNYRGLAIPRMTIVRNNLARLGPTRLSPARLR